MKKKLTLDMGTKIILEAKEAILKMKLAGEEIEAEIGNE